MHYWPFWIGGLALCSVFVAHWLLLHRMMAVSGRYSAMIDRLRFGKIHEPELSPEQLLAAVHAATQAEFGASAPAPASAAAPVPAEYTFPSDTNRRTPIALHLLLLAGLVLGGAMSAALRGNITLAPAVRGELFSTFFGGEPLTASVVLLLGGVLVGFGTRMAGGCTTGHGLCGMSRVQMGSIVATVGFFGAGVATSLLLEVLR